MVSFWPFKSDDKSAASFEKELKQLSTKITKAQARHDSFRSNQRRFKALWTLYTTFLYLVVAAVLTLVTGWDKWSYAEYTAVAGSPVLIFGVRTGLDAYYNYRVSSTQRYLDDLNKQRDQAISRLKSATKYDSTQQLLEKYGGSPSGKRQPSPQPQGKRKSDIGPGSQVSPQNRTGFAPPPTANIPGRQPPPTANIPRPEGAPPILPRPSTTNEQSGPNEEFAPNAFSAPSRPPTIRQPSAQYAEGPKWYDRIMDVVLGEDETQAKNRIALICQNCRLVNGQAPPGARTAEDIGKWRCSACHTMNGIESEHKQVLRAAGLESAPTSPVPQSAARAHNDAQAADNHEEDEDEESDGQDEPTSAGADTPPAGSTRSKARQRKKA
ncbi:Endoplasmic reticulum junction formation protein lunapark [Fulvia fulva]|uniref:Endoplasmic reticulum junction formation protein lunapark n=1 Tax=Passalora fulva TaxID=5499 RepID=A0A9Q8PDK5_PASFU|nr:Endoplasmic reticulum junction formation protein lunapark [Fulvia fulva]KAK4620683.1 Endoplasmic reticulum junction formation protein lunapark [Fulvia fulva]UJO20462.1 Endoplasmic reticulum junction formation protein lunapark [Fulvia fulva]